MASVSRREFAASVAAVGVAGYAGRLSARGVEPQAETRGETLRAAAAKSGLLVGAAVNIARLRDTPEYAALLAAQVNIVVPENELKFGPLRPTADTFAFEAADTLAAFAAANRMQMRGHNFVWHRSLPGWFESTVNPANAEQVLTHHIETVAGRYRGRIHSWDVVNEAIEPKDGLAGGLRNSAWQKLLPGYIDIAFRAARRADPQALLTYNDYGVEGEDEASSGKRAAVLALVRGMRARGVPMDAVGIQSHLTAGHAYGPKLAAWMRELQAMGLRLMLTEMDVNDRGLPADIPARDGVVAETYRSYLTQTLAEQGVLAVLTWGITDRFTWLNSEGARKDGQRERCLPFDAALKAKPAFAAERDALLAAPVRRA